MFVHICPIVSTVKQKEVRFASSRPTSIGPIVLQTSTSK